MRRLLFALLVTTFLTSCASPPIRYYFGDYSKTLYRTRKDNTPESLAKHTKTLEKIIAKSQADGLRVPPGIYCEYAYLLAKAGDPGADRYFSLEVSTYPESEKFVSFIRAQLFTSDQNTP